MLRLISTLAFCIGFAWNTSAAEPDPVAVAFFEQKIRPVLIAECSKCHDATTKNGPKGGFRVDTRDGIRLGGDSGPGVVPMKPTDSILIKALRGDDLAQMPPKGKLSDEVIGNFEKWIATGAYDPRELGSPSAKPSTIDLNKGREFWSFRPVVSGPTHANLTQTIDAAIQKQLVAAKLSPGLRADDVVLLRRVYVDLIGLFPSIAEQNAFLADVAKRGQAEAYHAVVDRLLASPNYGERWGRHWLDLARYADSNGKDENLTFHEAYLYRDYVIRSFNADKPFPQFVREQLAGDLLNADDQATRDEYLTATGFLVVGPKVLADRDLEKRKMDVVDEQLDTIGRTFLGMTLGCARCHDHKFDPVPTADYYALAGILSSTQTLEGFKLGNPIVTGWILRPAGGAEGEKQALAFKEHEGKLKKIADELKKTKTELASAEDKAAMRSQTQLVGITVDDAQATFVGEWKESVFTKPYVGASYKHDDKTDKGKKSATFTPILPKDGEYEVLVSYTFAASRAKNIPIMIRYADGEKATTLDQSLAPKIDSLFTSLGKFRFLAGKTGSVTISTTGTQGHVIADAVRFVPVGELAKVSAESMGVSPETKAKLAIVQAKYKGLQTQEATLKKSALKRPTMLMAVRDEKLLHDLKINLRGNPHQLGAVAPRGMLQVATTGAMPKIAPNQSGRRELADWIVAPTNPLTARVTVNRIWSKLFGTGIVRTVDNFGKQGTPPTHPELLDALAGSFQKSGSYKQTIRAIVLSESYQRSSQLTPEMLTADPENRLYSHTNRRRLDAEVIRDGLLQIADELDAKRGGPVVSHLAERAIDNESKGGVNSDLLLQRAVYLPIVRNDVPAILQVFDFADPDTSVGQRDATTVSTQALYLMNSPFVIARAKATADALLKMKASTADRVQTLFQETYTRPATTEEIAAATRFLESYQSHSQTVKKPRSDAEREAWVALVHALFCSTEFRFLE